VAKIKDSDPESIQAQKFGQLLEHIRPRLAELEQRLQAAKEFL
jgi:hypothetical protein